MASQRANYSALAAQLWLGIRLQVSLISSSFFLIITIILSFQLLGVFVVTAVGLIAVLQRDFGGGVDAGLVGLGLAYALSLTGILTRLLSSFTETEKELVSVERIHHYVTEPPKEPQQVGLL